MYDFHFAEPTSLASHKIVRHTFKLLNYIFNLPHATQFQGATS